ncbi:MAG: Rieske (2Fe-2S) protein [Halobacteriota archaeon]
MTDVTEDTTNGDGDVPDDRLHYVADVGALERGDRRRVIVDVEGREIAVFTVDGEYYALANYCTHQGGPACEGTVSGAMTASMTDDGWELGYENEDGIVACPWHGWEFDIRSGEHLANSKFRLPTYDVVVRDGDIYVVV